jgi:phage terminase small subunit
LVSKGYNDIRKTNINEVKIVDGKFSISESLKGDRPLATEVKKHFLEIISTYKGFKEQMGRQSDIVETAETLGGVVEAAKTLTLSEAGDWFDKVTIKRNMSELDKMDKAFDKVAAEARALDERLHSLYEDMGHILGRYYEISDIDPDTMKQRLGEKK